MKRNYRASYNRDVTPSGRPGTGIIGAQTPEEIRAVPNTLSWFTAEDLHVDLASLRRVGLRDDTRLPAAVIPCRVLIGAARAVILCSRTEFCQCHRGLDYVEGLWRRHGCAGAQVSKAEGREQRLAHGHGDGRRGQNRRCRAWVCVQCDGADACRREGRRQDCLGKRCSAPRTALVMVVVVVMVTTRAVLQFLYRR